MSNIPHKSYQNRALPPQQHASCNQTCGQAQAEKFNKIQHKILKYKEGFWNINKLGKFTIMSQPIMVDFGYMF